MHIKSPMDFWSGLIFIASGLFIAVYAYANYQMGSALRMGPGYFPVWLGTLTFILGSIVFIRFRRVPSNLRAQRVGARFRGKIPE